jgi:hypothetical protein
MNIILILDKPKEAYSIFNKLSLMMNLDSEKVLRQKINEYMFRKFPEFHQKVKSKEEEIDSDFKEIYDEIFSKIQKKVFEQKINGLI